MSTRSVLLAAATLSLLAATAETAVAGGGDRLIRRCAAAGDGDISLSVRYEQRGSRRRFDVEFEALASNRFAAGKPVTFKVAGVKVGRDTLAAVVGGDVVAEINLDSKAGEPGDDRTPFPANFPAVGRGTAVTVVTGGRTVLGCTLK